MIRNRHQHLNVIHEVEPWSHYCDPRYILIQSVDSWNAIYVLVKLIRSYTVTSLVTKYIKLTDTVLRLLFSIGGYLPKRIRRIKCQHQ